MLPIPLFKAPGETRQTIRQADVLAQACSVEYRNITGRENVMPRRAYSKSDDQPIPVCCVQNEAGYWQLYCNEPDTPDDTLRELARRLRQWENAPAMT